MPADRHRPRLLAVSHEGSQTGAPIVLATFLEWLSANADVEIHTLLLADGPLRTRFEGVGPVSAVTDLPGATSLGLLERGLAARDRHRARRVPATIRHRAALARLGRFDLVYLNSMTTLEVLPHLRGSPWIVAHVHEGPVALGAWRRPQDHLAGRRPNRWIAVGEDTASTVSSWPGVDPADVAVQLPFIDVERVRRGSQLTDDAIALRRSLGIPAEARVVVGAGTMDRRKGPDLFVQLACEVRRARPTVEQPVHFVWVGGDPTGHDRAPLEADIERAGADHIHLVGHVADPLPYFALAEVFALTSREDPFPLVCLEHAALEVPVVAYSSSGIRHLLAEAGPEAADGVIDYLDVGAMARRVTELLASPGLAAEVGQQLADAVGARHDVSVAGPLLAQELRPATRRD